MMPPLRTELSRAQPENRDWLRKGLAAHGL